LKSSDFLPLGKIQKPLRIKGFYGLAARAARLAKPRRALLGPSFTSSRLGARWGCARHGLIGRAAPDDSIDRGAWLAMRWRGVARSFVALCSRRVVRASYGLDADACQSPVPLSVCVLCPPLM
jgi:hypothetical protein